MTSIEWFYNELKHIIPNDFLGKYEQAKEMHKKEIIDAFDNGDFNIHLDYGEFEKKYKSAELYYQETFKQD
jgi:hypothetical protein